MFKIKFKKTGLCLSVILFFSLPTLLFSSSSLPPGPPSPFVGVYSGNMSGNVSCGSGNFAILSVQSTIQVIFDFDIVAGGIGRTASISGSAIAADGSFSVSLPASLFSMNGTATATSISGTFSTNAGCSGTFSGDKQPGAGFLAGAGGYYTGTTSGRVFSANTEIGLFSGELFTIIAAEGLGFMVGTTEANLLGIILQAEGREFFNVDPPGNFVQMISFTGGGVTLNATVSGSLNTSLPVFEINGTISGSAIVPVFGSITFNGTFTLVRQLSLPPFLIDVVLNLPGTGVKVLLNDNSSSVPIHADTAEAIATADVDGNGVDDIIASFALGSGPGATGGTFISKNGGPLSSISGFTAELITAGNYDGLAGEDLFLDFGADGLGSYMNDTSVIILTPLSPIAMASGDVDNNGQDDLIISIDPFGTVVFKNFSTPLVVLDGSAAAALATGDVDGNGEDDIIASFAPGSGPGGTGGTFIAKNQGTLSSISGLTAEMITAGNFDGVGGEDLFLDFGADGLGSYRNDTRVTIVTPLSSSAMASGDVDSNGQSDLIVSIGGFGTIAFKNFSLPVEVLDASLALDIATGNVDGN